jgi:hypothetical protein
VAPAFVQGVRWQVADLGRQHVEREILAEAALVHPAKISLMTRGVDLSLLPL